MGAATEGIYTTSLFLAFTFAFLALSVIVMAALKSFMVGAQYSTVLKNAGSLGSAIVTAEISDWADIEVNFLTSLVYGLQGRSSSLREAIEDLFEEIAESVGDILGSSTEDESKMRERVSDKEALPFLLYIYSPRYETARPVFLPFDFGERLGKEPHITGKAALIGADLEWKGYIIANITIYRPMVLIEKDEAIKIEVVER